jgi:hypothetical protein
MEYVDTRPRNAIDYIFDRGWNTRLAPCDNRWLVKQFRKGHFQLRVLPFDKNFSAAKFEKLRRHYYWDNKQRQYTPLIQSIFLLHKEFKVPYNRIWTETWFDHSRPDVLAKLKNSKFILIELGHFDIDKLFFIYDERVAEFWHDGKLYFYCSSLKSKPEEHIMEYRIKYRRGNKCAFYCACSPYLKATFSLCQYAWQNQSKL